MMDEEQQYSKSEPPPSYDYSGAYTSTQTTTTTTHVADDGLDGIGLNKAYLRSIPGILKIIEIVLALVCVILGSIPYQIGGWNGFVAGSFLFFAILWFLLYLLNVNSKFHPVMVVVEMIYYLVYFVFLILSWILALIWIGKHFNPGVNGAYVFFALLLTIACGIDAYFKFKEWRERRGSGGPRHQTTTVTSEVRY